MSSGASGHAAAIDALLPQTQCTRCGYAACRPYADAIAAGTADINRCPPGGDATIHLLAQFTALPYRPLDPVCGIAAPRRVAFIDEARCIGCTLCIQACPVDAIVGAAQQMHTVIVDLCSGCDLCVAPCPVDCIDMLPAVGADALWDRPRADAARARHAARAARLERERRLRDERRTRQAAAHAARETDAKRAAIQAAIARARARREGAA
jgi:electron transport complex protein RnfB